MAFKKLLISASRMKVKKRLGAPETILLKGFHEKFEPIRSSSLGCWGGCHRFWPMHILYFGHFCSVGVHTMRRIFLIRTIQTTQYTTEQLVRSTRLFIRSSLFPFRYSLWETFHVAWAGRWRISQWQKRGDGISAPPMRKKA